MRRALPLLLSACCLALPACGEDAPEAAPPRAAAPGTCAVVASVPPPTSRMAPFAGPYWGQEIWISYHTKDPDAKGFHYPRKREEALELAVAVCKKVHAGEEIGPLAKRYSSGNGGVAGGFVVLPDDPSHRGAPDARDLALMRTPVGKLTPLLEWNHGFWFARRIDPEKGRLLLERLEAARALRTRARVIHIHHKDAFPYRYEFDNVTHQQAIDAAWAMVRQIEHAALTSKAAAFEKFKELARKHSNAESRYTDGLLETKDPETGEKTEWIRWGDQGFTQKLLQAIMEDCKPGSFIPSPIDHGRGIDIVWVEERKHAP
jgi:hypothetical protein